MVPKVAITVFDMGYDFAREIAIMADLGMDAAFVPLEGTRDENEIICKLKDFDYVLAGPELWSAKVFKELAQKLKVVARFGVGMDSVDLDGATAAGVAVCNTPGANACSVAQHAIAMMLAFARGLVKYDAAVRSGVVLPRAIAGDLMGATIGFIGFGNIARAAAEMLSGFGCRLIAYDVYKDESIAKQLNTSYVSLDELAAGSDFVSIHIPLTEQTRGLINADFIRKMKPGAYLINTSRGGVVNEGDLVEALANHVIAGAGLDVSEKPMYAADNPFRGMDNTLLTPYVAFSSAQANRRTSDLAIESIDDHFNGRPIRRLLNPEYASARRLGTVCE